MQDHLLMLKKQIGSDFARSLVYRRTSICDPTYIEVHGLGCEIGDIQDKLGYPAKGTLLKSGINFGALKGSET